MNETTDLFGIPIPSTDETFVFMVIVHVVISLACVISGLIATLSVKGGKRHSRFGSIYYWTICGSFTTISILAIMSWPRNNHLLVIGILTLLSAYFGRAFVRKNKVGSTRTHTILMGLSYVLLLTGFYVDNGKNLPLWRLLPSIAFYFIPSIVGLPIIIYALLRHPLNRVN